MTGAQKAGGGLFVTGTDTGVGKTVLVAAIVAALRARDVGVTALKPLITGLDERSDPDWPPDHELLARTAGCAPDEVALLGFGPPVSPHLAAELVGHPINPTVLLDRVRSARNGHDELIVEGVGGLLVPITRDFDVRRFAAELGLPLLIAARPGLGTINHTLLTLEAARAAGLEPIAVVLTPWPADPDEIERSNRATIEDRGDVPVFTLPVVERPEPELLARAGAALPLDRWLGRSLR